MGCSIDFTGVADISFSCDDVATGGLKSVYLCDKADLDASSSDWAVASGALTISHITGLVTAGVDMVALGFNNKDGFSNFTDVKTNNADGSGSCVPTIQIEFVRMDNDLRNTLNSIAKPGAELVAFVETAAGTYHAVGIDFGLYASTVDGASGASRTDKNRYQLTLVGEENVLAYTMDSANYAKVNA